ncbi:MAG: amidohydrolase [Flavobacteriaceae bacterium]|nr:amidohydrolase [Flavobacteriaceae bacterium]
MQEQINLALIQTNLAWEQPEKNRKRIEDKIDELTDIDIVILPEMFTSGFTMHPERVAETMDGDTVQWMKEMAATHQYAIMGSLVIAEQDAFFNRLLFVTPEGEISHYDKKHLFALAGEDKIYKAGTDRLIIDFKGWRICPLICYDLRFPVWSRNKKDYDLLIYVANWPEPRVFAWEALLRARAIENMAYVVGVNRVGKDENNHFYTGDSGVYDILGHQIESSNEEETIITALHKDHITYHRKKLQFLDDQDPFVLRSNSSS